MLRKKLSAKSDVYALGMTLWSILTRKEPFIFKYGEDTDAIIKAVQTSELNPVPTWVPSVLSSLLKRSWHKDPKQRPTASKFLSDLESAEGLLEKSYALPHGHGLSADDLETCESP